MSFSVFPAITPGFSFRPTSPFLAALAAAALRRLESPLTAQTAPQPIQPLSLGECGALLMVEAAVLEGAREATPAGQVQAAFAGARTALASATEPAPRRLTLS
jgi:hypothetical protein